MPTTFLAESGKSVTNVMPKKTPDPTDVRPRMNPKMTPMITAYVLWRVVSSPSVGSFEASHRPRIETNVRIATAIPTSDQRETDHVGEPRVDVRRRRCTA